MRGEFMQLSRASSNFNVGIFVGFAVFSGNPAESCRMRRPRDQLVTSGIIFASCSCVAGDECSRGKFWRRSRRLAALNMFISIGGINSRLKADFQLNVKKGHVFSRYDVNYAKLVTNNFM